MPRYLLLPEDEAALHAWVTAELGLMLVTGPVQDGAPRRQPLDGFPWPLPDPPVPFFHGGPPTELLYWRAGWGANDLPPVHDDGPLARVAAQINAEAGIDGSALHLERSRLLVYRRCGWTSTGALHVGAFGSAARRKDVDEPEVKRCAGQLERWLKAGAERVPPDPDAGYRPAVFARPEAARWVRAGGVVWPWDG